MTSAMKVNFTNHLTCCRFCIQLVSATETFLLNHEVEQKFFDLTHVKLRSTNEYSRIVCRSCLNTFNELSQFRIKIVESQFQLQQFVDNTLALEDPFATVVENIKIEEVEPVLLETLVDPIHMLKEEPEIVTAIFKREYESTNVSSAEHDDLPPERNLEVMQESRAKKPRKPKLQVCSKCDFAGDADTVRIHIDFFHKEKNPTKKANRNYDTGKCREKDCNFVGRPYERKVHRAECHTDAEVQKMRIKRNKDYMTGHRLCPYCSKSVSNCQYQPHIQTHVCEMNNTYNHCDLCKYKNFSKRRLRRHMETHRSNRPKVKCSYCDSQFISANSKKLHESKIHLNIITEHKCYCGKVFESSAGLVCHRIAHHEIGEFKCHSCDKIFINRAKLKYHVKTTHEAKVPCEICGLLVPPKEFYKNHLKTHEMLQCPFAGCNKKFTKTVLKNHLESVHGPKKEVSCSICGNIFASEIKLRGHKYRIHQKRSFQCQAQNCSFSFECKDNLVRHYQKKHKRIDEGLKNVWIRQLN